MSETDTQEMPLPPATLESLVFSLKMQAEIELGFYGKQEGAPEPDLKRVRHLIDLLGMIEEKTRGNLSIEEKRLVENSLTDLRFRYMHAFEEARKPTSPTP
ncbi:MAG: DUF1844 domain-containing protein [Bryobacteraceae bacterium]